MMNNIVLVQAPLKREHALFILIGVLIAINVVTFIYYWNQVNVLTLERDALKQQVDDLSSLVNTLQSQVSSLSSERDALMQENEDLNTQITMLQNQIENLQTQVAFLQDQINILAGERDSLMRQVNKLQNQVDYLQGLADNLWGQINYLQGQLDYYESIVNLELSRVLADNEAIAIPGNSYHILSYTTEYAGYLIIEFTATNGISIHVGSNFTGEYYYTYPNNGTTTNGTFYVPVFPGTTYIFLDNRGPFRPGVTVTIIITYVY